jgi:hypothetical protein
LKPFLAGGSIWVNDTPYYTSYGAGLEAAALLSDRVRDISTFVFRKHDNQNTWYLPSNSIYRGMEYSGSTNLQFALSNLVTLYGGLSAQRYETEQTASQNYMLWGTSGGLSFHFTDPAFKSGLQWNISLTGNVQWWTYDAPDPVVDPNTMRTQQDVILNLVLSVPLDDLTTFSLSGGRFVRSSSLPNYAFENDSVMFGVSRRF